MTSQPAGGGGRTIVALHAHPDDEALLTAGTMARAAAEDHRVAALIDSMSTTAPPTP